MPSRHQKSVLSKKGEDMIPSNARPALARAQSALSGLQLAREERAKNIKLDKWYFGEEKRIAEKERAVRAELNRVLHLCAKARKTILTLGDVLNIIFENDFHKSELGLMLLFIAEPYYRGHLTQSDMLDYVLKYDLDETQFGIKLLDMGSRLRAA